MAARALTACWIGLSCASALAGDAVGDLGRASAEADETRRGLDLGMSFEALKRMSGPVFDGSASHTARSRIPAGGMPPPSAYRGSGRMMEAHARLGAGRFQAPVQPGSGGGLGRETGARWGEGAGAGDGGGGGTAASADPTAALVQAQVMMGMLDAMQAMMDRSARRESAEARAARERRLEAFRGELDALESRAERSALSAEALRGVMSRLAALEGPLRSLDREIRALCERQKGLQVSGAAALTRMGREIGHRVILDEGGWRTDARLEAFPRQPLPVAQALEPLRGEARRIREESAEAIREKTVEPVVHAADPETAKRVNEGVEAALDSPALKARAGGAAYLSDLDGRPVLQSGRPILSGTAPSPSGGKPALLESPQGGAQAPGGEKGAVETVKGWFQKLGRRELQVRPSWMHTASIRG